MTAPDPGWIYRVYLTVAERIAGRLAAKDAVKLRDIVLAMTSSTLSTPSRGMFKELNYAPCADFGLLRAAHEAAADRGAAASTDAFIAGRSGRPGISGWLADMVDEMGGAILGRVPAKRFGKAEEQAQGRDASSPYASGYARTSAITTMIERVAPSGATVLVRGESGAGKEIVARAVHEAGPRSSGPFVVFDAGAVSSASSEPGAGRSSGSTAGPACPSRSEGAWTGY